MSKSTTPPPSEPEGKPAARGPYKYDPRFAAIAAKLCSLGATDHELAEAFQVSDRTVIRWRSEFPEFGAACKVGKGEADDRVEASLYQRAVGYAHQATKVLQYRGEPVTVEYVEHLPPDTVACIFWLKNRRPQAWRDKVDIDATVRPCDVTANPLPPDEWDRQYSGSKPS